MAGIPAYCPHCGTLFGSNAIVLGPGSSNISLRGGLTNCPNCGLMAQFIDGTFDVSQSDVLTMLSGPQFSADVLRAFSGLVERAARNEITERELQDEVKQLDPDLAAIISAKNVGGIATLLLLVLFMRSCNFEAKVDLNRLYDQFTEHGAKKQITVSPMNETQSAKQSETTSDTESSGKRPNKKSNK
jgi:hypothetical protein